MIIPLSGAFEEVVPESEPDKHKVICTDFAFTWNGGPEVWLCDSYEGGVVTNPTLHLGRVLVILNGNYAIIGDYWTDVYAPITNGLYQIFRTGIAVGWNTITIEVYRSGINKYGISPSMCLASDGVLTAASVKTYKPLNELRVGPYPSV